MAKLAALLAALAVLAVALPHASATLQTSKAALQRMRASLQLANIANEYIYDRDPNVLTLCTNKLKKKTDGVYFTQYIDGCIAKALGHTTINDRLKKSITLFCDEALATSTTIQRLDRVTQIIACAITESLATRKK